MNKYFFPTLIILVLGALFYGRQSLQKSQSNSTKDIIENKTVAPLVECSGKITSSLTEGPYYKANTPERSNIREPGTAGENLIVTGYVFDKNCKPIANAWLDFWQADGNGVYDNVGFKLRGHQFTDSSGKYNLETVVPARYPGRTPHIHVKVRANEQSPIITSQLFFPGEDQNQTDSIFDQNQLVEISSIADGKLATYNFVLE